MTGKLPTELIKCIIVIALLLQSAVFSAQSVSPVLERVVSNCDGKFTAFFGYYNRNAETVQIPIGSKNRFTGFANRNQPTDFLPGRHRDVFSVDFEPPHVVWSLDYISNHTATAGADKAVNKCEGDGTDFLAHPISPVLERVVSNCDGTFTGVFGYSNSNTEAVHIPIGPKNRFSGNANRNQPTEFLPGRHRDVFSVDFMPPHVVWSLEYLSNHTATAGADKAATECEGEGTSLPPHPGEEGNLNIEGTDADADGVRDDIQIWIHSKFEGEPEKVLAWKQLARDWQTMIESNENKENAVKAIHAAAASSQCGMHTYGMDLAAWSKDFNEFRAEFLNTFMRSKAYLKADRHFSGEIITSFDNKAAACKFSYTEEGVK